MSGLDLGLLYAGIAVYLVGAAQSLSAVRKDDRDALRRAGWTALAAAGAHAALLFRVGLRSGHVPVSNAFEAFLFLSTASVLVALCLDWLRNWSMLWVATLPLSVMTCLLAAALWHTVPDLAPAPPPASSLWTSLHVVIALASYGAFALAFVSGVLYLIAQRQLKQHASPPLLGFMPPLETMARLNVRAIAVGVVLLVAGLVVGYLQARQLYAGRRGWRMDPKIILTSLTVLAYAAVLVLSRRPTFKGRRTALASVFSFALVLTTFWASVFWSDFHRFR